MTEQLALHVHPPNETDTLRNRLQATWSGISVARESAKIHMEKLAEGILKDVPVDSTFVVYGSLARCEFTQLSDLDWTLLVDGAANPEHQKSEIALRRQLAELNFKIPGASGTFGGLTFSHDLLHKIGGEDDTNRNTTQRILLLLESTPVGDRTCYSGVVRNVLRRYIEEDYLAPNESPFRVPRFLLNDVARYWRTMAVDFAQKRRARAGEGWALKTAKLQMSRKLMYAAGLLSCFSCKTDLERLEMTLGTRHVITHLERLVCKTPLDIVAGVALTHFGECSDAARILFDAYDAFLRILDNPEQRAHLEQLPLGAENDSFYIEVRAMGKRFGDALTSMFFDTPALFELIKRYGVF